MENWMNPLGDQVAAARVSAAGAFVGPVVGFVSVGVALGVFTLELDPGTGGKMGRAINTIDAQIQLTNRAGNTVTLHAVQTDNDTIVVRGFNSANAATAAEFSICVLRKAVG